MGIVLLTKKANLAMNDLLISKEIISKILNLLILSPLQIHINTGEGILGNIQT